MMKIEADPICGRVDALAAINIAGSDAVAFAQRICANDVAALEIGEWQWNCVLSPQGRVVKLFRLWRRSDEVLTLVLPSEARAGAHALLKRYVLRSKLAITEAESVLVAGDDSSIEQSRPAMRADDGRWLGFAAGPATDNGDMPDVSAAWQAVEVSQGVPWLNESASETYTPQALSLDRLDAFSVRKGCYPGQEIVARMHFLGQNKRELRRFASAVPIPAGATLSVDVSVPRAIGTVVTAVSRGKACELLAVVQRAAADAPIFSSANGSDALHALPLATAPRPIVMSAIAKA